MKEGFVTLLRNMALRPLSEAFKLVIKADLEISHDKEIKEEISITRGQAPRKQKREEANGNSQKCIDLDTPVRQLVDMSYPPSKRVKA